MGRVIKVFRFINASRDGLLAFFQIKGFMSLRAGLQVVSNGCTIHLRKEWQLFPH